MEGDRELKIKWGNPHNSLVTKLIYLIEAQRNVGGTLSLKGPQPLKFHPISVASLGPYNELKV